MTTEKETKITEVCSALDGLKCNYKIRIPFCDNKPIARIPYLGYACRECVTHYLEFLNADLEYRRKDHERYISQIEYL